MNDPTNDAAPRPGEGGGAEPNTCDVRGNFTPPSRKAPVPLLHRPPQTDSIVVYTLAALMRPAARAHFTDLGIGPLAFEDHEARRIASILISDIQPTLEDVEMLARDDGETLRWIDALDFHFADDKWAISIVDLFARQYVARWLPAHLRWYADRIECGDHRAEDAVREIDDLLRFVRLPLRPAERSAA
jgi:hypothetical protein